MAEVVDESLECECKAGFVQALFPDSSLECERCALWIAAAIGGYMFFCLGLLFLWTCGQLEISVAFEGTHFGERRRVAVSARKQLITVRMFRIKTCWWTRTLHCIAWMC
jgi:hypothetical protein